MRLITAKFPVFSKQLPFGHSGFGETHAYLQGGLLILCKQIPGHISQLFNTLKVKSNQKVSSVSIIKTFSGSLLVVVQFSFSLPSLQVVLNEHASEQWF